jgi:hypothetical protein
MGVKMVTDDKKREIEEIVDQVMQDPEKRRAVRKALQDKAQSAKAAVDEDDDDLWDNLPI